MEEIASHFQTWLQHNAEARAFCTIRDGNSLPWFVAIRLGMKSLIRDPFLYFLRNFPGGVGIRLRQSYYRRRFCFMGKSVLIDEQVRIDDPSKISISDFVWIGQGAELRANWGSILIGKRVHIAENVLIAGGGHVVIEDYGAIARGAALYSHSEVIYPGKRMSGPMVREEFKGMKTKPILVKKDAVIGVNALILPGVTIGEGAIVGPQSMVNTDVAPWDIVMGVPAKSVGTRPKVFVPDM